MTQKSIAIGMLMAILILHGFNPKRNGGPSSGQGAGTRISPVGILQTSI